MSKNTTRSYGTIILLSSILLLISFDSAEGQTLYLGDTAEQSGCSLSAVAREDSVPHEMVGNYAIEHMKDGYKIVAVEIIVGNISNDLLRVNPLDAVLVDSDGFVYEVVLAGRDGQIATTRLSAGEKVRGWVSFEIPVDATLGSIKYSLSRSKFLRAGLATK